MGIFLCDSGTHEYTFSLTNVLMCKETGYENKMDEYTFSLTNVLMCKETGYENKMDEYTFRLTNVLMCKKQDMKIKWMNTRLLQD